MSEQDLLSTPLNSPNQETQLADVSLQPASAVVPSAPAATVPMGIDQSLYQAAPATGMQDFGRTKSESLSISSDNKVERLANSTNLKNLIYRKDDGTSFDVSSVSSSERDSAAVMSVDQAQKMLGAGARTIGSFMDNQSVEDWGQSVVDQQIIDLEEGGYEPLSGGMSVREMFKERGAGSALGRVWEMMQENLATSGVSLAGGAAAALTAPFSGTAAIMVLGGTTLASGAMGVGESALEMEDKGVEINDAKAIGTGILIGLLDRFGAGKVIPKNLLTRMTGDAIVKRLVEKGFVDAAKGVAKTILGKAAWESGTEVAQEALIMNTAASQGAEYTKDEIIDRFIDVAFVAAGMGGTTATVSGTVEYGKAVSTKIASTVSDTLADVRERAEVAAVQIEEIDRSNSPTPVEGVPLDPTTAKTPDSPTVALIRFSAANDYLKIPVGERTTENTQAYMDEYNKHLEAAQTFITEQEALGTPVPKAQSDFVGDSFTGTDQVAEEYTRLVEVEGATDNDALKIAVDLLASKAEGMTTAEDKKTFIEDTLGSMDLSNVSRKGSPTSAELQDVKNKLGIKDGENTKLDTYIALRKSVESVSDQVMSGEESDGKFKGLKWHIAQVTEATKRGNSDEATSKLDFLKKWSDYQAFKTTKFQEIQAYNAEIQAGNSPTLPTKLGGVTYLGKAIDNFTIDFEAFGVDKTTEEGKKVWFYNKTKTPALIATMETDSAAIADVHAQLASLYAPTVEVPVAAPVKPKEQAPVTEVPSMEDQVIIDQTESQISKLEAKLAKKHSKEEGKLWNKTKKLMEARLVKMGVVPVVEEDFLTFSAEESAQVHEDIAEDAAQRKVDNPTLDPELAYNTQTGLFEEATDVPTNMVVTNDSPDSSIKLSDFFENTGNGSTTDVQGAVTPDIAEDSLIGKSYLKTVRNFFKNYPKITHILKLDDRQTKVLGSVRDLLRIMYKNMPDAIESLRGNDYAYSVNAVGADKKQTWKVLQFPMLLLAKGAKERANSAKGHKGTIKALFDTNVLNIINITGLNWVTTMGQSTLYNTSEDIHKIASSEGTARKMSDETTQKLHIAGTLYGNVVEQLGKAVFNQLGIKVKQDALAIHGDRMITSLGMAAVESLIASGMLVKTQIPTKDIYTLQSGDSQVTFIRIATEKTDSNLVLGQPTPLVQSVLDLTSAKNASAYTTLIQKISGTEPRAKFPRFGNDIKKLKAGATYNKTSRPLPKKVISDVNRMNKVDWRFKPDMLYLLQPENREEATEFFKQLQGFEYAIEDRPLYLQMGDVGRNLGIVNEIQGVFDFYDMYVAEGSNGPFHFSYNTGENGRHNVNESAFSYQGSKLVRHLIFADKYATGSKDGFSVEVTAGQGGDHFQMFQYAVVQALSKSVKIDHGKHDEIVTEFYRIANDMDTRENAAAVFADGYGSSVTEYLQDNGLGAHGLDGLQALGSYLNTSPILDQSKDTADSRDNSKTFTTDLAIETDAITSGFMLTLMNFGALGDKNISMLSTGGIFLADKETGEFHESIPKFREKTGNTKDVYTMLIDPWKLAVDKLVGKHKRLSPILELVEMDRNTAKPIIMQGSYMAQYKSLVNNFINGTSDGQLGKLYERIHAADNAGKVKIFTNLLDLKTPGIQKSNPTLFKTRLDSLMGLKLNESLLPYPLVTKYEEVLSKVYGETLTDTLDNILTMRDTAQSVNKMVNMMSWYYRWQVKKAIDAAGGYASLTPAKLTKIYEDPALTALRPYLPTPDSVLKEEGLAALANETVRDHTSTDNVVKISGLTNNEDGRKSAYTRSVEKRTANEAARSIVVTVQSIDDTIVRAVMSKYNAMSAFDAVYTSIGQSVGASRTYNQNVASTSEGFSIFENTYNNFMEVMAHTQGSDRSNLDGFINFMSEDTEGFNSKNFSVSTFLPEMSGVNIRESDSMEFLRDSITDTIAGMTEQNDEVASNRKEFFERLRVVDHMGMPGTAFKMKPGEDSLGSITPVNDDEFSYTKAGDLIAGNVEKIFDGIKDNRTNSPEHVAKLRDVLNRIVSKVIKTTDKYELHMQSKGETSYGRQRDGKVFLNIGKGLALNLVTPSAQESYVHELVHVITRAALSDPKANAIVRKLSATMRDTVTHLEEKYNGKPWRVFLQRDAKGNPVYSVNVKEEIKAAKAAYDYVFNNAQMIETQYIDTDSGKKGTTKIRAGLHEFLAYALTNEHLNSALVGMKVSKYQEVGSQDTIFQKLLAILENVMAWAKGLIEKAQKATPAGNNAELIEQMVEELTHVNDKFRFRTQKAVVAMTAANKKVVDAITEKMLKPLAEKTLSARDHAILERKLGKAYALLFVGYINPVSRIESRTKMDIVRKSMQASKRNFITELYREITGNVTPHQRILEKMLMDAKKNLESQRDDAISAIAINISRGYIEGAGALSTFEDESHTRVLIETNISSLIKDWTKVNIPALASIISDDATRAKAIVDVRKKLNAYGRLGDYYIGMANSLGSIMATQKATVDGSLMNAALIARADDLKGVPGIRMPEVMKDAEALINELATLTALEYNTQDARQAVANVMLREHANNSERNAAINTLTQIDEFNKQSLARNFDGNNIQQSAGYSKDIYNPDISIRVDTVEMEAEYKKQGYVMDPGIIPTDPADTDSPATMRMYVNKSGGHGIRQKFIMSVTNTNMSGQSITKRASESGDKAAFAKAKRLVRNVRAQNKLEALKLLGNPDYVSSKPNIMIPVTDQLGKVMDFRYTMEKSKRARVFEQKAGMTAVLSHMYGGIVDKEETPRINNKVIEELHLQYREKGMKGNRDFVEVSLNAKTEELRELYMILPDSTKRFIKSHTGSDKVMIQAEFIDIVFGRKKVQLPGGDKMQVATNAWTQMIAAAKKNIVIKWPATLSMNVLSNTMLGILSGVPPEYMVKMQAEGAIKLNNYVEDGKQLRDLNLQLMTAKKTGKSTKKILADISTVESSINTSPILPLIKAGVFQTIVEDIDVLNNPYSYASKISEFFDGIQGKGGKVGGSVAGARQAYRYAYMSDDTAVFKALMKTTQFSDFAGRYAIYQYMTVHESVEESAALEHVMDGFVNYETPTNKYIQFANDYGLQMFTKYGFRILRAISALLHGKPLNAIGFLVLNDVLAAGLASPFDATPFDNYASPVTNIISATTQSGTKAAMDTASLLGVID